MKVLFYLLFFLSITCPASHAESTFNMDDIFVIAKARKLGHSDPFSFGENTSAIGSSSYRFECHDPNCKTCNYSTGVCSICNTYYFLSGRLCKSCSSISVSNGPSATGFAQIVLRQDLVRKSVVTLVILIKMGSVKHVPRLTLIVPHVQHQALVRVV